MKKIKKRYFIAFSLFFLLGIVAAVLIIYFPNLFKRIVVPKSVDVFGPPRAQTQQSFPATNPQFTAVIGYIKPASLHQQSVTVYKINDVKKIPVFQRPFYADGFRGNGLNYTLSSNSAEITQNGNLGTLGCTTQECTLPWSNFYIWETSNHTFSLDNANHKEAFQQLLTNYQNIDKKGCAIVSGEVISGQDGVSFTQLYKKYLTAKYYCSQSQGILPSNLVFFLQAEKTLEEIINGNNVGSGDIRALNL